MQSVQETSNREESDFEIEPALGIETKCPGLRGQGPGAKIAPRKRGDRLGAKI